MRFRRRRRIVSEASGNSNQLLGLSLFIMLLAFFIVLNSVSTFKDEKITPIMGSIEKTFSTRLQNIPLQRPSTRPDDEVSSRGEGDDTILDKLEDLFESRISSFKAEIDPKTGTMWVRTDYDLLNEAIIAAGQPAFSETGEEENAFLPTLISLLNTGDSNQIYRMDMILNMEGSPIAIKLDQPDEFLKDRNRIGKFARLLEIAGLSSVQMSVGLNEGEKDTVDLIFRPYAPHDALKDQEPAEEQGEQAGGLL